MRQLTTSQEAIHRDPSLVHNQRASQLTRLGIPGTLGEIYADYVDWPQIARPVRRRCPPGLARRTPACQWGFAVQLAAGVHRSRDGRLMLGGSPPRLLRLNPAAARLLRSGRFAVTDHASAALARRLVDIGVAHPRPPACPVREVTIVIPVRDRAAALDRLLARLRAGPDSAGLPQSLLAHPLLRPLDDIAYGTGLWAGALRNRSVAHLLPRFAARAAGLRPARYPGRAPCI